MTPASTGKVTVNVAPPPGTLRARSTPPCSATILWLIALRREGQTVLTLEFLKLGALIMPPALLAAIGAALLF